MRSLVAITICMALALSVAGCSNRTKIINDKTKTTNDKRETISDETKSAEKDAIHGSTAKANSGTTAINKPKEERNFKNDLNMDGVKENINVIFKYKEDTNGKDDSVKANIYSIVVTAGTQKYIYEVNDVRIYDTIVNFVDFNTKDSYMEFYINAQSPNGSTITTIYRFDSSSIKKICDIEAMKGYDKNGKIYTEYSITDDKYGVLLSYYDINKGKVEFIDKNSLKGKELKYDKYMILFTDTARLNQNCVSKIDGVTSKTELYERASSYNQGSVVDVCDPNEVLTIVDVDNTYNGHFKNGVERNIRIKVKTTEGKEGWLEWLNGGV